MTTKKIQNPVFNFEIKSLMNAIESIELVISMCKASKGMHYDTEIQKFRIKIWLFIRKVLTDEGCEWRIDEIKEYIRETKPSTIETLEIYKAECLQLMEVLG